MKIIITFDERTALGKSAVKKIKKGGVFWYHPILENFKYVCEKEFGMSEEETEQVYFETKRG